MNVKESAAWHRIKEHLWGPVGSIAFHGLLIATLFTMAFRSPPPPPPLDKPTDILLTHPPTSAFIIPPPPVLPLPPEVRPLTPDDPLPTQPLASENFLPPVGPAGSNGSGEGGNGADLRPPGFLSGSMIDDTVVGPYTLPGLVSGEYSNRWVRGTGEGTGSRGPLADPVHAPILRALRWLKTAQNKDGSWGPNPQMPGDVARTGLALLAFLGYGKTTQSEEFGATVEQGIHWLKSQQTADGHFNANSYMHAIATYAVSEAFGLTRIPELRDTMDQAVTVIMQGQQKPGGGWDYQYAQGPRRDTSVGAWQAQALKAAIVAGCTVPGLKETTELAIQDLKRVQDPASGRFGYEQRGVGSWAMTGAGVLCLQLLGHGSEAQALQGLKALRGYQPRWEAGGEWAHYTLYYITQARFQESEAAFRAWYPIFVSLYAKNQNADGSWSAMLQSNEEVQGRVYTTTLATLTLEVFFRYVPSYFQPPAKRIATPSGRPLPANSNATDVTVRIL